MLRSDAQGDAEFRVDNMEYTLNSDVISEIEKELSDSPYDIISLVFLLYDVPDTALQRLIVYQRVSKDAGATNLNLLQDWYRHVNSKKPTCNHEFMEALLICQLYSIVRKLGFHVPSMMKHYQTETITYSRYINPLKKALYKLCENITMENFTKIKKSLLTFDINTTDYESCELVFLELMCKKFITLNQFCYDKKVFGCEFNTDKLINIIEKIPGLRNFAIELRLLQNKVDGEHTNVSSSAPENRTVTADETVQNINNNEGNDVIDEIFKMLNEVHLDEETGTNLKSDTKKKFHDDSYNIKNPNRLGVCIIINQEDFYPSRQSIQDHITLNLEKRLGSTIDKTFLEKTMKSLKFDVHSRSNLARKDMFDYIKEVTQNHVHQDDSVFMLCMMSHGVRGHVFASDSVKVKVEEVQKYLDSNEIKNLRGIPKVLIIQACQVNDTSHYTLAADGPSSNYYIEKSNFLIYWATAPEFAAYRDEKNGSIFIRILCHLLTKQANKEHLYDIFTKINDKVNYVCTKLRCAQVPIFESTLRKKLYLYTPE